MQEELNGLNKLNELKWEAAFCLARAVGHRESDAQIIRVDDAVAGLRHSRGPRPSGDFVSLGLTPHRHRRKILMKFWRRKDGQFRSGGLLVGDRPFSLDP